jgi:hypothetical protein
MRRVRAAAAIVNSDVWSVDLFGKKLFRFLSLAMPISELDSDHRITSRSKLLAQNTKHLIYSFIHLMRIR